jgi:hypothetical protein
VSGLAGGMYCWLFGFVFDLLHIEDCGSPAGLLLTAVHTTLCKVL